MTKVERSLLAPFSASQMFALVDRVEEYPAFLPWCDGTSVAFRDERLTRATIKINFHGLKQSFTTENIKIPHESIMMKLVEGPFNALDGGWQFQTLAENACKIKFELHYQFSSKTLEKLLGPMFNYVINTFVDAFIQRAESVYGQA